MTPGDTLGVLAIAYVAIGAWCGRFASGSEPPIGRVMAVLLVVGASALVPIWLGIVELLRGDGPPLGYLVGHLPSRSSCSRPSWRCRRGGRRGACSGAPREVEPWAVPT